MQRLFDQIGPLDVVVNCAGFGSLGLITDLAVDEFRAVVDVCLTGAFIVAKYAGQKLREGGSLVSISSLNGRQAAVGHERLLLGEGRPVDAHPGRRAGVGPRGIRVNAVAPGFVDTPLTERSARCPASSRTTSRTPRSAARASPRTIARCRGVPVLAEVVMADRRGARPQRRRTPQALSRRARPRHEAGGGAVSFAGKQAIVTGAGSGIGAALCRRAGGGGRERGVHRHRRGRRRAHRVRPRRRRAFGTPRRHRRGRGAGGRRRGGRRAPAGST